MSYLDLAGNQKRINHKAALNQEWWILHIPHQKKQQPILTKSTRGLLISRFRCYESPDRTLQQKLNLPVIGNTSSPASAYNYQF
ncbi:unnamed protein product [Absidia cylindrospora]